MAVRYNATEPKIAVAVEYVWCSGKDTHHDLRSKIRTVMLPESALRDALPTPGSYENPAETAKTLIDKNLLSEWNFDGSSTAQAKGRDTEIIIRPVAAFPHPFIGPRAADAMRSAGNDGLAANGTAGLPAAFVALCECFTPEGKPTEDNTRYIARSVFDADEEAKAMDPWYGLEQEYVITHVEDGRPLGWPTNGEPAAQGPYYCGTGSRNAHGRKYAERHYAVCVGVMGLKVSGLNAEVMLGQWEFQVGPARGIEAGDHMLMARWAYLRMLEVDDLDFDVRSKPMKGDWNGSGMHCNFSTVATRGKNGVEAMHAAIARLGKTFFKDVAVYGDDNIERLTGMHETSRLDSFNCGVGTRNTSCRIPNNVMRDGAGYFEDRRPSSSADPYLVTSRLFASAFDIPAELLDNYIEDNTPEWLSKMKEKADGAVPCEDETLKVA